MIKMMMSLCIILIISQSSFSQYKACGTTPTLKDIRARNQIKVIPNAAANRARTNEPTRIAITAHIARRDDGTGGLTQQALFSAINNVNNIYELTNMEFFIFGDINYIDDSDYYDFESSQEAELASKHFVENTINIYFFNSAKSGDNPVCGYARFPGSGIDRIVMDNGCARNGSTLPHEIGHYFALYHTHGKTNTGTTDELVDGSNCTTAGDDICDTPADPNLSGFVDSSCNYTGFGSDANGEVFMPNTRNLMSYSRKQCRDEFSQGQADVIVAAYQQYKTYLYDRNYASNFDVNTKEVCVGNPVTFEDKSVNAVSYKWTFEGGTPSTSTEPNPMVIYDSEGTFDVTLEITEEEGGTDTKVSTDLIEVKGSIETESISSAGSFEEGRLQERVINDDNGITWEQSSFAFTDGANSASMDFYNYGTVGAEDYLIIATLNTETEKSFELSFDYAYASYDETYFDGLAVEYRDPCGEWQTVWYKEGIDLNTAPSQQSLFIPTSDQWKTQKVLVDVTDENTEVIEVALKGVNGYGNYLWVDNYQVDLFVDVFSFDEFNVTNASCEDTSDGSIVVLIDGIGNYEYSIDGVNFSDTNEFTELPLGSYTVTVRNSSGTSISSSVEVSYDNEYPELPVIVANEDGLSVNLEEGQTIRWFWEGVEQLRETTSTIIDPKLGTYTVEISNGLCAVLSDPFVVLSVDDVDNQIKIYPNPTIDRLTVETGNHGTIKFLISDVSGKQVMSGVYDQYIDVNSLTDGLYLIQLEFKEQTITKRFFKE